MFRYQESTIINIRNLRKKDKLSYRALSGMFKIPSSTIRNWCYVEGIKRGQAQANAYELIRKSLKESELPSVPSREIITGSQARFYAGILYGCEGAKYPASNRLAFANSDPNLVVAFINLLRLGFNLNESKFFVHLQIHTTHSFEELRTYWSKLLNLPENQFIKPTITSPGGKKHRTNYLGTCTLKYHDYRIQLKLLGIFEAFTKSFQGKLI